MMIKIYDKDANVICAYDGNKWVGKRHANIMCKAVEIIIQGMDNSTARKIMRLATRDMKPPQISGSE